MIVVQMGSWWEKREQRKRSSREQGRRLARLDLLELEWEGTTFSPGSFTVTLMGLKNELVMEDVAAVLRVAPGLRDESGDAIVALLERAVHIGPQAIAEDVAQHDAVRLKIR